MSEYTETTCKIKDTAALVDALVEMGFAREQIEVCETPKALYGYQGDRREQLANVIIRRNHVGSASNDIGFRKKSDGTYEAIVSDYDTHSGGLHAKATGGYNQKWLNQLTQNYSEKLLTREHLKKGHRVQKIKKGNKVILSVYW